MNFDLSPDQKLLVDTAQAFAKRESPVTRARRLRDEAPCFEAALWKQMADLGWIGVVFPEEAGGLGGTFLDLALVLTELGTTLVPEPLVSSLVAGRAVLRAGNAEQWARVLHPLIAGDTTLALAHSERDGRYSTTAIQSRARRDGGDYVLDGTKLFVLNGEAADHLVVSAVTSAGAALFLVARNAPGISYRSFGTIDGHRAAHVTMDGVRVGELDRLGAEGGADAVIEEALDFGAAALCAEGVGVMRAVLAMTTEYLSTREQFGVKIGTFQVLAHRAVDMFIETELAKSTSILASIRMDDSDASARRSAVSVAKAQLTESGKFVTAQAIQLHGGIGVTDEHDVGLYFKRMQAMNALYGDENHHVQRYAKETSFG